MVHDYDCYTQVHGKMLQQRRIGLQATGGAPNANNRKVPGLGRGRHMAHDTRFAPPMHKLQMPQRNKELFV